MAKLPHGSFLGQLFVHGLQTGSMRNIRTFGLSLQARSKSICQFNFELNPVCKICSWDLFEITENDLKTCVLDISALLTSQGEVASVFLRQSTAPPILYTEPEANTMLDSLAFCSPLFFTVVEFHQSAQPISLDTVS